MPSGRAVSVRFSRGQSAVVACIAMCEWDICIARCLCASLLFTLQNHRDTIVCDIACRIRSIRYISLPQ